MSNKQRLFEVMERLNPEFKTPVDEAGDEQAIIADILAVNEDANGWWNKFIQYGKKGLLTAAIIIAVAFSAQAQQQSSPEGVLKAGVEMSSDSQIKQDVYNFMIGAVHAGSENNVRDGKMENFKTSSELILHYMRLRNGETPELLSQNAKNMNNVIINMFKDDKISNQLIKTFIAQGQALKTFNYTQSGNNL
jgi:hypothetical protein